MKSRLAVSLLFIVTAANFTSDAIAAFEKVKSWTGTIYGRCTSQACHRLAPRDCAPRSAIKSHNKDEVDMIHLEGARLLRKQDCGAGNQSPVAKAIATEGKMITFDSASATKLVSSQEVHTQGILLKLLGARYHGGAFDFVTTAARQIRQLLCLIRIK
jgi:hypothetical protein